MPFAQGLPAGRPTTRAAAREPEGEGEEQHRDTIEGREGSEHEVKGDDHHRLGDTNESNDIPVWLPFLLPLPASSWVMQSWRLARPCPEIQQSAAWGMGHGAWGACALGTELGSGPWVMSRIGQNGAEWGRNRAG
jgi:hypothetical protein